MRQPKRQIGLAVTPRYPVAAKCACGLNPGSTTGPDDARHGALPRRREGPKPPRSAELTNLWRDLFTWNMFTKLGGLFAIVKKKFPIGESNPRDAAMKHKILMPSLPIW